MDEKSESMAKDNSFAKAPDLWYAKWFEVWIMNIYLEWKFIKIINVNKNWSDVVLHIVDWQQRELRNDYKLVLNANSGH